MAALKLNLFSGIFPRVPESLLPERAATVALNCDFAYGELRNTKDGYLVNTMTNQPRSIYTDDGLAFYTWTTDVNAVRSPMVSDTFNRLYYTDGTAMKVANRLNASATGGHPGSAYFVGVPRPSSAPALSVIIPEVNTGNAVFVFRFHYEYGGVKYQEQVISPTIASSSEYRFTPPAMLVELTFQSLESFPDVGEVGKVYKANDTNKLYEWKGTAYLLTSIGATPAGASKVLRITATAKTDGSQLYDVYSENSSFPSTGGLYSLALTAETNVVTYLAKISTGIKEADKEARAYIYTYVNTYNEEGPPSAPSTITTSPLAYASVTVTKDAAGFYAPIKEIRIYRTPTGSTIADYFYVGAVQVLSGAGPFVFTDSVKAAELNEPMSSLNNYPPPSGLVGLMTLPNGILCAWKDNELWFSEAFKPWAWPPSYAKPLAHRIVGAIAHGSGAVVTTVGNPFMVSGVSSDSMSATRINVDQAGVSKWSIAVANGSVMYASNDGIVVLNGGVASLAQSSRFFTRDVWRSRYANGLASMRFAVWDGRLVVFSGTGAFTPFMIRFDEADSTLTDMPSFSATCAFVSQISDQFYYANGSGLYQFNGGSAVSATWQSRELVVPRPLNFGILQSVCEGSWSITLYAALNPAPSPARFGTTSVGPWSVNISATGMTMTASLTAGVQNLRIPGGFESDRWKVRLTGSGRFRELRIAQTGRELGTV